MPYTDSPIQEIKERLDVVDIVREYVPLQQAGANWRARCPFHNEKTPSFMVSKEKQIWHCFGCSRGGDVFEFIKEIEGVEFPEALRTLAQKAGVVLRRQDPKLISVRTRLFDLMNESVLFFMDKLKSDAGAGARQYLRERGLSDETLKEWQIGWALDEWESLSGYLRSKGFKDGQILNSGMVARKQSGGGFYDRFRGRIMFPIANTQGQVVGFTGRVLVETEKSGGKYVNTPQTALYDKSRVIFGLNKAKQEIRKNDLAVVVEGQMDVIASHQAGIKNVAASSGTALTEKQLEILKRYTENLAFCFDADAAGEQATERGIDLAMQKGMNVKIIQLKEVKDPDECIKKLGVSGWQKCIEQAVPIMKYYFELIFKKIDTKEIEGRREIARQLLGKIVRVGDRVEQDYWVRELAERLGVDEKILRESVRRIEMKRSPQITSNNVSNISNVRARPRRVVLGEYLVGLGLQFPETVGNWEKIIDVDILGENKTVELAKSLKMYYNREGRRGDEKADKARGSAFKADDFGFNEFKKGLKQELQEYADILVMLVDKDFGELDSLADASAEVDNMIRGLKKETATSQLKLIEAELRQAEKEQDDVKIQELGCKLNELMKEMT